ncbi:MAG TPA: phosphate signaling complex protein PhoU [Pyrinomonadaceae bacterium]|nr:phosphate signaling complex protein PhoU [Pyrinomonadaceae bacterium]
MRGIDLPHHTSSRFNEDMERIRRDVLAMGGLVEQQLEMAIAALISGDADAAGRVTERDREVNQMEIAIDGECQRVLATRTPAAGDLRLVIASIKAITDLERIGDESRKISSIAARLADVERPADRYREVKHLGLLVQQIVHDALDAFARLDASRIRDIVRRDRIIDEEYESIQRQNITFMMEDPRTIRRALDVMWVVRALERVGDHAKNICEHVVYIVHGKDVRHSRGDDSNLDP